MAVGTLGSPDERNSVIELSPDGQRVAVSRTSQGNQDIWLIDVARDGQTRFTDNPSWDSLPLWSPDGSQLMFSSGRSGFGLFQKPANGARDEQLMLASPHVIWPADWSPDGRVILYMDLDPKTGADLWALPLGEGEKKPFVVLRTRFTEAQAQFSPDGQRIAYTSDYSGRAEVYVRPFPGSGDEHLVSTAGGSQPRWRRDGRELFYVAADRTLMAVPIGPAGGGRTLNVGTAGKLFPTRLGDDDQPRAKYAVSADGQRFLMNVVVDEPSAPPITIVQNWTAGLRK